MTIIDTVSLCITFEFQKFFDSSNYFIYSVYPEASTPMSFENQFETPALRQQTPREYQR